MTRPSSYLLQSGKILEFRNSVFLTHKALKIKLAGFLFCQYKEKRPEFLQAFFYFYALAKYRIAVNLLLEIIFNLSILFLNVFQ